MKVWRSNFAYKSIKTSYNMKMFLSFIIMIVGISIPTNALAESNKNVPYTMDMEISIRNNSSTTVHRSPVHIAIDAIYYPEYNGDCEGEIFLYRDNNLIENHHEINTSLILPFESGSYRIDIITEDWTAQGYIQL